MPPTLFFQSEIKNPYLLYETMLKENPVYWDEGNKLWAIYSYTGCLSILNNPATHIPSINFNNRDELNAVAILITHQLARLSNESQHTITRQAAMLLAGKMKPVSIADIIDKLITTGETDWVEAVCKKLPVLAVLQSFDFNAADADIITGNIAQLIKLMLPHKSSEQVKEINKISVAIYAITEKHILTAPFLTPVISLLSERCKIEASTALSLCVSNLIGLFIQSYDAGRGVLSNSLLQIIGKPNSKSPLAPGKDFIEKSIVETLRFDPPVQNTRRIAVSTILLAGAEIKKGDTILVVLAAANRDPHQFNQPGIYNIERSNNADHLTFGIGNHMCVAKHFSVSLATTAFSWLFERFKKIRISETVIEYEPLINVRLPKKIMISLKK